MPIRVNNNRDANNWRIPRAGTVSNRIYRMMNSGKTYAEMADGLKISKEMVYQLVYRIKNPDKQNAREYRRRTAKA